MSLRRPLLAVIAIVSTSAVMAIPSQAAEEAVGQSRETGQVPAAVMDAGTTLEESSSAPLSTEKRAQQLRDKMPYFVKEPTLVGNALSFKIDVSPMREAGSKSGLLDRVSGRVFISRDGVDLMNPATFASPLAGQMLLDKKIPARIVRRSGTQTFSIALAPTVAKSLRGLSRQNLARRVKVVIHDEKDIDPAVRGYDRTQVTASGMPPSIRAYLAGQRKALGSSTSGSCVGCRQGATSANGEQPKRTFLRSLPMKPPPDNTPGTIVVFNGSPFDLNVAMNNVQCITPYLITDAIPSSLASNTSFEYFQVAEIAGNTFYTQSPEQLQYYATEGMKSLESSAAATLERASYLKNITQSASRGLTYFTSSMFFEITLRTLAAAIAASNACTNAGSALNLTWTATNVGSSQTAGNVNYWVPSYSRTGSLGTVRPASVPYTAPGSPLTAYNATSANGLAVSAAQLQSELGSSGSLTLSTLNSNQQNGSYNGFWCNYQNQQAPNPNSTAPTVSYGATALGGGISPDWGPCNATSVTGSYDYLQEYYGISNASQLENEGFTILIGYSTISTATAGPHPALAPQAAANSAACLAANAPCIYTVPPTATNPNLVVGCMPGTWNMMTPWNGSSPSMNLSSPPGAYQAVSNLTTQLAFTGVTANGSTVTDLVPGSDGGNVTSSFSPTANNPFNVTPAAMSTIQNVLGGAGSYVTQWHCVMTANTTIPAGIKQVAPSANAMNLVWYGVPIAASVANPAGNVLSPPS